MQARQLSYGETETLLAKYGIRLAPARMAASAAEAVQAAAAIGLPVALKLIAPERSHKTDSGLVILDLASEAAVRRAAEELLEQGTGLSIEGLLVQRMASGGIEILVGASLDPQFGPVVAFGAGGILVELLEDVSLRLPPLSPWQAGRMLAETRVWKLLQGYRGHTPADVQQLVDLLVRVARLAGEQGTSLISLDLNPVLVLPSGQGLFLVDARAVVRVEA